VDALIGRIAARQERVITLGQLYALGLTDRQIRRRVKLGLLHVLHRGVFIVGPLNITPTGHLKGALLTLGETSFLSHSASIAAQGLRPINIHGIEVTVIADRTPKRPGLIVHRTSAQPHRQEIRHRFGLRYSSLARALIEVARDERPAELMRLVTVGIRRNLVDLEAIEQAIARHASRPGVDILRSALRRYVDPGDRKSGLELSFDAYCATDPRIPPYRKNVHIGPHEWDVVFADQQLVVELDGRPYHVALQDMDNDRAKDIWAQRHGLRVMRMTDFTWEHGRAQAIGDLLALLALGGWLPRAA
jgi:hypothetical protein